MTNRNGRRVLKIRAATKREQAGLKRVAAKLGLKATDFKHLGNGLYVSLVAVTPAMAAKWLVFNTNNRTMKERSVAKYSSDMQHDRWRLTHEGIAFGFDSELKDGQNRLESISRSDCVILVPVFIGVDDEAKKVIDQNVSRTPLDAAKFSGMDTNRAKISAAKYIHAGRLGNGLSRSNSEALELLELYTPHIDYVLEHINKQRGVTVAPVIAAIARAHIWCEGDPRKMSRLNTFCQILSDGNYGSDKNRSAAMLRDLLTQNNFQGSTFAKEAYEYTEFFIDAFLKGKIVKRRYKAQEEIFPLAHEEEAMGELV